MSKPYLFINPTLAPPGGAQGVANVMLELLAQRGSVTVLSWEPPDFAAIDEHFGTNLSAHRIETITVAPRLRRLLRHLKIPHYLLQSSLLVWRARQLRDQFGLCLSACNDLDLGPRTAVQYIHFPNTPKGLMGQPQELPPCPWPHNPAARALWPLYIRLVARLLRRDLTHVANNITLANSHWTAAVYEELYQTSVHRVLYPPPLGGAPPLHLARRANSFLSIGRVDGTKNWLALIAIIAELRGREPELSLTLAGSREDGDLLAQLQELAAFHAEWLCLELDPTREQLDQLIATHQYGLHGMVDEHYGMAVAELLLGGCLTFIHDSGGQVEIVTEPEARYQDHADAVAKLGAVLGSPRLREALASSQRSRREMFSRERFQADFLHLLDELEGKSAS